jgi:hypothetical protein
MFYPSFSQVRCMNVTAGSKANTSVAKHLCKPQQHTPHASTTHKISLNLCISFISIIHIQKHSKHQRHVLFNHYECHFEVIFTIKYLAVNSRYSA